MLHPDARLGVVQYDPNQVVTQLEFPLFVVPTTANPNVSAPARPIAAVLYLPLDHGCELRTPKLAPHLALLPFGDPSVPCGPAIQAETAQLNGAIAVLFYLPPVTSLPQPLATNATIPLFQLAQFPDGRDLASRLASPFATPDPHDPVRIDGLVAAGRAGMGNMWHVTLVVVVVLLTTALAVSVAMHALVWRRRREVTRRRRVRGMAVGVGDEEEMGGVDVVDEAMLHVLPLREFVLPATTTTTTTTATTTTASAISISEKPGAVPVPPPAIVSPDIAAAHEPASGGTIDSSAPPTPPLAPPRSLLHTLFPLLPTNSAPLTTTCAICLDDLVPHTTVRILPCRHAFHPLCIDPWLTTRSAQCPLCKTDVRVGMVRDEDWRRWWAWARPEVVARETRAAPSRMYTPVPGVPGVVDLHGAGGRAGRGEEEDERARARVPGHGAQHERADER
ncbi:E3 ubiquitin-protein ligase rnf13 [Allomyces javanicus]|nr:E3 ubiquitin-protein ligase rnf13 [Allomyces javanicus]